MSSINQPNNKRKTSFKKKLALHRFLDLELLKDELTRKGMQKGHPDILSSPRFLQQLVDAIKDNPRLLYDEIYVTQNHKLLIYKGESYIKVVINKLLVKLLAVMHSPKSRPLSIEECSKAMDWILKIFEAAKVGVSNFVMQSFPRGRPRKASVPINETEWNTFRDKGMRVLGTRRRKSYDKFKTLCIFVKEISSDFSCQVDDKDLEELSLHYHKHDPLLRVLFGYLKGLIKPPQGKKEAKAKKFAYRVKRVTHILKTSKMSSGHKN